MKTLTLGIDPGANGAIAVLADGREPLVYSFAGYAEVLETVKHFAAFAALEGHELTAWIEDIPKFGGVNASSMLKLAYNAGAIEGICLGRVPLRKVTPKVWQAGISGVGGTKGAERKRALKAEAVRRFPSVAITLRNCDALLIAAYGQAQRQQ